MVILLMRPDRLHYSIKTTANTQTTNGTLV